MMREYLFLVLASLLFASINPVGKILLNQVTPLEFALIRSSLGFLLVSVGLLLSGEWKKLKDMDKKSIILCIIFGIVAFFLFQIFIALALINLPASINSILLNSIIPIFVLIITSTIFHKKITKYSFFGVILGILGMSLVVFKPENLLLINTTGVTFSILAGICWGINTLGMNEVRKKYGTFSASTLSMFAGLVISFLSVSLFGGFENLLNATINLKLLFLYAGLFATGFPVLFYYYSLKKLGAAKVSVSYFLTPIFGVALSVIILQESMTVLLILGAFLVLVGIGLVQKEKF